MSDGTMTGVGTTNLWSGDDPQNGRLPVQAIVVHSATGDALARYRDPRSYESMHYVVAADGHVTNLVGEADVAWACGTTSEGSAFPAFPNPNRVTLNVCVMTDQDGHVTPAQVSPLQRLLADLRARYRVAVIGHARVDPVHSALCPGPEVALLLAQMAVLRPPDVAQAGWTPRWRHVSELYHRPTDPPGNWGDNDCFEASLARYLREAGYPYGSGDPALTGWLRQRITGLPDSHWNGYTWSDDINRFLPRIGLDGESAWRDATPVTVAVLAGRPWALLLVSVARLAPRQYPDAWIAGLADVGNHFILRLPNGRCNDPLAASGQDTTYSAAALAHALSAPNCGAYVMPDPRGVTWVNGVAHVGPVPVQHDPAPKVKPAVIKGVQSLPPGPGVVTVTDVLRSVPSHSAPGILTLRAGTTVQILNWLRPTADINFQRVAVKHNNDRLEAWFNRAHVRPTGRL